MSGPTFLLILKNHDSWWSWAGGVQRFMGLVFLVHLSFQQLRYGVTSKVPLRVFRLS